MNRILSYIVHPLSRTTYLTRHSLHLTSLQKSTRDTPSCKRAGSHISTHQRTPFVLPLLQLLDLSVGVDVVISESCLWVTVFGGL
jgi:hypothetical protein